MKTYELTLILDAQLPPEKQEELVAKYLDMLKSRNVEILTVEKWGKKKLAFTIEDRQYGYYLMTKFRAPAQLVPEIEHFLKVTSGIFRYLILLRDPRTLTLMQNEGERLARAASRLAEQERLMLLERGEDDIAVLPGDDADLTAEEGRAGSGGKE